jgi:hypothetical protein
MTGLATVAWPFVELRGASVVHGTLAEKAGTSPIADAQSEPLACRGQERTTPVGVI